MHRIDGAGHVDNLWVPEDPDTQRPPTEITPEFMNAIQEELATFIVWAGIALAKGDNTQLRQALVAKFAGLDVAATKAGVQDQTYTAFTTAGVTGAFTLTPVPAIAAYAAGQRFRVKFHAAGNFEDTINVSGLGLKSLKQYDSTGVKVAPVIAAGQLADVEFDGVDCVLLDPLPPSKTNYFRKNLVINGDGRVRQNPGAAPAVSASLQYGLADLWMMRLSSGVPSAGALTYSANNYSRTKSSIAVNGLTCTGAGVVDFVHRIEAAETVRLNGKQVTVSALVYHDVGANVNWTIALRKANTTDIFSAVTVLQTSAAVSVLDATATRIYATYAMGASEGDTGLEILIQASVGAVTGKNLQVTEVQLEETTVANVFPTQFEDLSALAQRQLCQRFYEIVGNESGYSGYQYCYQAASQNIGALIAWKVGKRITPTLSLVGATGNVNATSNAPSGASTHGFVITASANSSGQAGVWLAGGGNYVIGDARL